MKNQLLLAACTGQAVYILTYLSAKRLKGTGVYLDLKACAITFGLVMAGAVLPAWFNVSSINGYGPAFALLFALLAVAYFYHFESGRQAHTNSWLAGLWMLLVVCFGGLLPLFHSNYMVYFASMTAGLLVGTGLYFSVGFLKEEKAVYGQNIAVLLAGYCVYLLMDASWAKSPETANAGELSPQNVLWFGWTALVLLLLSFLTGLFLINKNKTSC
jgi:hypothetical protein